MRYGLVLVAMGFLVVGCSGGGTTVTLDAGAELSGVDTADGTAPEVTEPEPDVQPDETSVGPELVTEVMSEDWTEGPECAPGEGCFLDPCEENGDCLSGWCLDHMGEKVCSQACTEECPSGWLCQQVSDGGPDLVFVCVSQFANLCRPCVTGGDCDGAGGTEDVCVDYGDEGAFCGGKCTSLEDCPWGFLCSDAVTVDGVGTKQCVAEAGVCPCTEKSIELALFTECEVTNEFGTCSGMRVCTEEGLSDCDAPVPAAETCNGVDDDCDGEVDEPTLVEGEYVGLCEDDNDCTDDACLGEAGCEHEALTETECVDGDPCTVGDHCDAGVCVGSPVQCDDNNPCTDDSCDGFGGCTFAPNVGPCDDGDPCTLGDLCSDGACAGTPVACECTADADCAVLEDGDLCNGTLYCDTESVPFQCQVDPATVVVCEAAPEGTGPCQESTCNPATGLCALAPANEGFGCDDGDVCTIGELCAAGSCVGGVSANCDDGNPCTADTCDAEAGCEHEANPGACDDGNACTVGETCQEGGCVYASLLDCDDGDVCTTDSCDPVAGCLHSLNTAPCDDGDVCTTGDHCNLGECIHSGSLVCDDGNPCTDDSCNPQVGCVFAANAAACDDGNACTVNDHCASGACAGGGMLDCDDGNVCTADGCDAESGCTHVNADGPCNDGDACTKNDSCAGGVCGGAAVSCDDGNVCTADSCDSQSGCQHDAVAGACDDGDACTENDACTGGVCGGAAVSCDDGNVCTTDSCDSQSGCLHVNNSDPCPGGSCSGGECVQQGCVVPASGNLSIGGPAELYGFCWYVANPGGTCDATCAELGGNNLVPLAENAWDDNCPQAGADDVSTWFYNHGNPGNWNGIGGATSGHGLGYGYYGSGGYYGKCITGTSKTIGAYPGEPNTVDTRTPVCPCFWQ